MLKLLGGEGALLRTIWSLPRQKWHTSLKMPLNISLVCMSFYYCFVSLHICYSWHPVVLFLWHFQGDPLTWLRQRVVLISMKPTCDSKSVLLSSGMWPYLERRENRTWWHFSTVRGFTSAPAGTSDQERDWESGTVRIIWRDCTACLRRPSTETSQEVSDFSSSCSWVMHVHYFSLNV